MTTETLPDVEGGIRAWLRADPGVAALVGNRVFFEVPRHGTTFPLVTVARAGGGSDPSDVPIDRAVLRINVWGDMTAAGTPNKAGCTAVMNAVWAALLRIRSRTTVVAGTDVFGVSVNTVLWLPDPPPEERPRYSLTVFVTAIAS